MKTDYGVLWLDSIKEEARNLRIKASQEGSSLSSRASLDMAAVSLGGFTSYFKARQKHNAFIFGYISHHDECRYCRLPYIKESCSDRKNHENRHRIYEQAKRYLGALPEPYGLREKKKHFFSRIYNDRKYSQTKRVKAALIHIKAHFDRSLEAAINNGYYRQHPDFKTYIRMIHSETCGFPKDVQGYLIEAHQLGMHCSPIEEGYTYWSPRPGAKLIK